MPTVVTPRALARLGMVQARVDLANKFTRPSALMYLVPPAVLVTVALNVDIDTMLGGANGLLAGITIATLFVGGFVGISSELVADQDDGTVLRARTLPFGLGGYLVGKTVSLLMTSIVSMLAILIPAHLFVAPVLPTDPLGVVGLIGLAALGLFSGVPLGAVVGAALKSPLAIMPVSLLAYGVMVVSGVFFPLSALPAWVAVIGKVLPVYWVGLLGRHVLADGPLGDATTTALAIGVPLVWGVLGMILVPRAMDAMARRQSGSRLHALAARRQVRGY